MKSITVLILTYNEKLHIERCIRSVQPIASKIFVVDSFSTDQTMKIARTLGAEVVQRKWKNYADQFHWAIENCGARTTWLMRMDADEYLEAEAQKELFELLPKFSSEIDGIYIKRKIFFEGQWIRHGGFYPQILLRVWRTGRGRIEQRWMDEHIILPPEAKTITLKGHVVDDNLKGITFWVNKHNKYGSREMVDLLNNKYSLFDKDDGIQRMNDPQAKWKRIVKEQGYSNLPVGFRAFLYFIYRYFFLLGFLDGKKGLLWHFMQGLWYRLLVDIKMMEIEERSHGDITKIRRILQEEHDITL